jgi:hypothetical protein
MPSADPTSRLIIIEQSVSNFTASSLDEVLVGNRGSGISLCSIQAINDI